MKSSPMLILLSIRCAIITAAAAMTKPANIPMSVIFFTFGEEGEPWHFSVADRFYRACVGGAGEQVGRDVGYVCAYIGGKLGFCVVAEMDITSVSFTEAIVTSDFIWLAEM